MSKAMGRAGAFLVGAALNIAPLAAQTFKIEPEKLLYRDMTVVGVGPFVSVRRAPTGVLWSRTILHSTAVPAVRVHVQVRQGRTAADWRIRIRDLSGREVESFAGGASLLAAGEIWSGEVGGRGAEVELVSDRDPQDLEIAVDKYAYRVISPIPLGINGVDQRIPIRRAPQDVRGWAPPVARVSFIRDEQQYVCTGFLMTRDLLLTNERCLGAPAVALSALVQFGFDSLDSMPTTIRVARLEAVSVPLDYALVRLNQAAAGFGHVTLPASSVAEDQALVIIQHPAGEYKQASIDDCRVRAVSRPGVGGRTTDFGHLCDTLAGSSGAPLLDRESGEVVGLHHLGIPMSSEEPVNQGVHVGLILEDLRTRIPALHAEIMSNNQGPPQRR